MRTFLAYLTALVTTVVFLLAGKLCADLLAAYVLMPRLKVEVAALGYLTLHVALGWIACRIFYGLKARLARKSDG